MLSVPAGGGVGVTQADPDGGRRRPGQSGLACPVAPVSSGGSDILFTLPVPAVQQFPSEEEP